MYLKDRNHASYPRFARRRTNSPGTRNRCGYCLSQVIRPHLRGGRRGNVCEARVEVRAVHVRALGVAD